MKKNGFTLVELIIGMFIGLLIMAAVYDVMTMAQRTSASVDRKVVTQQDTRTVLDLMASEIRMASFNPRLKRSTWTTATGSTDNCMPKIEAYKGIQVADTNTLAVGMDITPSSGNGIIGDVANEYIVYSYDTNTKSLTRSVNCGPAQAILGGTAPYTNIINNAAGVDVFRYFNGAGNEITTTVVNSPANSLTGIPAIRRILITLVVETTVPDTLTRQTKKMVYSTNVIVRNHVLNPIYD
jgi:prepilin-type N-terminal cleavage/methylation domain-containing protein